MRPQRKAGLLLRARSAVVEVKPVGGIAAFYLS